MAPGVHIVDLLSLSLPEAIGLVLSLTVAYTIARCTYNVYFHPLAKIPGPKLWAASIVPLSLSWISGKHPATIKAFHDKYGPMVRVAPEIVSFCSASSWKDIYGHVGGRKQFPKSASYRSSEPPNIVTQNDPVLHGAQRKLLSNAFSTKALDDQEEIVHEYVDTFIAQMGRVATGPSGANMVSWYNWLTFDVIGDMAFGDPFGSLKEGKPHFWVEQILGSIKMAAYAGTLARLGLKSLQSLMAPKHLIAARQKHRAYSRAKIEKRIKSTNPRKDLVQKIVQENDAGHLSIEELVSNGQVLIVAGSETTATTLAGFTYYLCRSPKVYEKLVSEIRSSFTRYEDIKNHTAEKLPYLKANINEALRIYPPVPIGLSRESPGETVDGVWIPAGTEVSTSPWAATHSEENFHRPYEYIPERWIDPECKDKLHASQPFSLGSRVCLGRSLALMELNVTIAKMLWVYDMELLDDDLDWVRDNATYALWEKPALRVRYTRRPGIEVPLSI